jgi:hypothetical protein
VLGVVSSLVCALALSSVWSEWAEASDAVSVTGTVNTIEPWLSCGRTEDDCSPPVEPGTSPDGEGEGGELGLASEAETGPVMVELWAGVMDGPERAGEATDGPPVAVSADLVRPIFTG